MEKNILIIDDDEEICEELAEILKNEGYQVETVFDGSKASLMIGAGYDLILLDLKIPGLNGFEILSMIRQQKFPVRVLILTGRPLLKKEALKGLSGPSEKEENILKLADGIINKPFEVKTLLSKIKHLLR
jgi:DNA-binding response OmpR family regulator